MTTAVAMCECIYKRTLISQIVDRTAILLQFIRGVCTRRYDTGAMLHRYCCTRCTASVQEVPGKRICTDMRSLTGNEALPKGWTVNFKVTPRGRRYGVWTGPSRQRLFSYKAVLRVATGNSKQHVAPADAVHKKLLVAHGRQIPSAKADSGTHVSDDFPKRAYSGTRVPAFGTVDAGSDLPGYTVERVHAADGTAFLLYRDMIGRAVGNRHAALVHSGQLTPTRTHKQLMLYDQQRRAAHLARLQMHMPLGTALKKRHVLCQRAFCNLRASDTANPWMGNWKQGEYKAMLHATLSKETRSRHAIQRAPESGIATVDMYCGMGGLSLGFRAAGFEAILGVDSSVAAVSTYRKNHCGLRSLQAHIKDADLQAWTDAFVEAGLAGEAKRVECILLAGCPCQPYSKLGTQQGTTDERDGLNMTVKLAIKVKPLLLVVENVPRMMHPTFSEQVTPIWQSLRDAGYKLHASIHRCEHYGVPQQRRRLIVTALRTDSAAQPGFKSDARIKPVAVPGPKPVPADAVTDDRAWYGEVCDARRVNMVSLEARTTRPTRPTPELSNIVTAVHPAPTILCSSLLDNGYTRTMLVPVDVNAADLKMGDMRLATRADLLSLQSFPDDFVCVGSVSSHGRMIGNAVPAYFAYCLARGVLATLADVRHCKRLAATDPQQAQAAISVLKSALHRRLAIS